MFPMFCCAPRLRRLLALLATLPPLLCLLLWPSTRAAAQTGAGELIRNGSFEGGSGNNGHGGGVPDWMPYGAGYEVDRREHHGGDQCIRCDSLNPAGQHGAQVMLELNQKRPVPILVTGWSKADQATGVKREDYSLYIDVEYTDGSPLYGIIAPFRPGSHDWQRRQATVFPTKPIKTMSVYALFRNHTGTVWFDDFSAHALEGANNFDSQPLAFPERAAAPGARLRVAAGDGLGLKLDARGAIAAMDLGGQKISGPAGGFYLRDVAADGPVTPMRGNAKPRKAGGYNIDAVAGRQHIVFSAAIYPDGDALAVDGEMTDKTNSDRAVTVYLALPVQATGWLWGQDIRSALTIEPGREYTNQVRVNVGATGGLSLYPYGSVAGAMGGVGIASQLDWPSVYRIFYNSAAHQFVIAWDFALTGKTAAWPSHNARFRCRLFRLPAGPPEWAFRQATARFYRLNPHEFERHAKAEGIWMPFTDPAIVQHEEDFGFAYHEGDNSIKTDDALGILSFRYTEPSSYWLNMPPSMPRTYENALNLIHKNAAMNLTAQASDRDREARDMARAVLSSGTQDETGHFNLEFRNEPWANGAVFVLNPNPELPVTPNSPTKASLSYTLEYAAKRYPLGGAPNSGQDGEYLDSLESWMDVLNYRYNHLRNCPYPLPFSTDGHEPVMPQWYAVHTFARFLHDDLHNRDRLLMANTTPVRFSIFAPLLDVMGIEVNWLESNGKWQPDSDETFNLRRTMSYHKPYLLLMNTNFDKFTSAMVEKYFQRSLFYGVYPSMFSVDAANNPYWDTPRWYNRDRPLFKKYIPIIKRLSAAGWEPIPYAHTANARTYVERYGARLFTLFNDSAQATNATAAIDLRALNLSTISAPHVVNLITGQEVPAQLAGATLSLSLPLAPEEAAALEIQ
jgi:hypothetical protein